MAYARGTSMQSARITHQLAVLISLLSALCLLEIASTAACAAEPLSTIAGQEVLRRFGATAADLKANAKPPVKAQLQAPKPTTPPPQDSAEPDFLLPFDSVLHQVLPISCLVFTGKAPSAQMIGGASDTHISIATTATDLAQDTSFSMSAAFGIGIFKGSAVASMLENSTYSGSTLNAIVKSTWMSKPVQLPLTTSNITLDDKMATLFKTDPIAFRRTCGDSFIYSLRQGASLEWTLSVVNVTETEKKDFKLSISAAAGLGAGPGGKMDSSIAEGMSRVMSHSGTTLDYKYSGDPVSVIPAQTGGPRCATDAPAQEPAKTDPAAVLTFVSFLDCRTLMGGAVVGFGLLPYSSLPGFSDLLQSTDVDTDVAALMRVYDRLASLKNYIDVNQAGNLPMVQQQLSDITAEIGQLENVTKELARLFRTAVVGNQTDKNLQSADLARFNDLIALARSLRDPPQVKFFNDAALVQQEFPAPFVRAPFAPPAFVRLMGTYNLGGQNPKSCPGACGDPDRPAFVFIDQTGATTVSLVGSGDVPRTPFAIPAGGTATFKVYDSSGARSYADNNWDGAAGLQYVEAYFRDTTFDGAPPPVVPPGPKKTGPTGPPPPAKN
jgi:hypothetical protein